jgi:hypothetical protein
MIIAFLAFGLLFQSLVSATVESESLGIHFENGNLDAPLLKLDYATYRATYNETYDVRNQHFAFMSNKLTHSADLRLQECEIRSSSFGTTAMGKASSSIENRCHPRWKGRKVMHSI